MSTGDAAPTTPFRPAVVGRDEEITRLSDLADAAVEHGAQMVLLSGDAGIGKSTLTAHFLDHLREGGWGVHVGHCIEYADRPLPFGPVVAVLRSLLLDDLERVDYLVGHHRDDLTGLVPELGGESDGTASLAGDVDRLFDAIASVLTRASEARPIAFLIEDIHWSDAATRDLLTSLVHNLRSARVLMLVTERTGALERGNTVRTWLAEQRRFPTVHSIELEGLAEDDLAAQVSSLTGEDADSGFVSELMQRTGGNPYFAHELVVAHGQVTGELPSSLREFITSRLQRLGEEDRSVLRAIAIAGGSVSHQVLDAMVPEVNLGPIVRTLFDSGVLVAEGQSYAFDHALVREAILEDVLPFEAQDLHRAAAEALEASLMREPDLVDAVGLAIHWGQAGNRNKSAAAAWQASVAAGLVAAFDTAADMCLQALADRPPDSVDLPSSLEMAASGAEWLNAANRVPEAIAVLERVLASDTEQGSSRANVLGRLALLRFAMGSPEDAEGHLRHAERIVGDEISEEAAEVHQSRVRLSLVQGQIGPALSATDRAIEIAEQVGPKSVLVEAMTTRALAVGVTVGLDEGVEYARRARGLAEAEGFVSQVARSYRNEFLVRLQREGRTEASLEAIRSGLAFAEQHCGPRWRTELRHDLALAHAERGEFRAAQALLDELLESRLSPQYRMWILQTAALSHLGVGDLSCAEDRLSESQAIAASYGGPQERGWQARLRAEFDRRQGRLDDALVEIDLAVELQVSSDNASYIRESLLERARLAAAFSSSSHELATEVVKGTEELLLDFTNAGSVNAAFRALASVELAVARGNAEIEGVENALALMSAAGYAYDATRTELTWITALSPGELTEGAVEERLRKAVGSASEWGSQWLEEAARRLAASWSVRLPQESGVPVEATDGEELPFFLTDREIEVMSLLAEGLTNKAIGERLFVSPRTVSTHISNLLPKVGASNRGEAAATFHRENLGRFLRTEAVLVED